MQLHASSAAISDKGQRSCRFEWREMRKASLEGMSEAFGLLAEANDRREAAREEEGRDLLEPGQGGGLATRFVRGLCGAAGSPTNAKWEGHPC